MGRCGRSDRAADFHGSRRRHDLPSVECLAGAMDAAGGEIDNRFVGIRWRPARYSVRQSGVWPDPARVRVARGLLRVRQHWRAVVCCVRANLLQQPVRAPVHLRARGQVSTRTYERTHSYETAARALAAHVALGAPLGPDRRPDRP